ncbi:MAG: FtsX-like permease family protein [Candidatus Bathyarchaeota archaeon]|nr:FtsX-like permease family protein [Candidatus Bathyarchaeota archaeon]
MVNNISSQTSALSQLASVGDTYIVTEGSGGLGESEIDAAVVAEINGSRLLSDLTCHRLTRGAIQTADGSYPVTMRGIDDPQAFFRRHNAAVNGSASPNGAQAVAGVILSKAASIHRGDQVNLTIHGKAFSLSIVGVVQANGQTDTELILPLTTLQELSPSAGSVSLIEFSTQNPAGIANLTRTLPSNLKIECTQQTAAFAADINNQLVAFITVWSVSVYVVVAAASYVIATRVVNEAKYEFCMLGTLGAKKPLTTQLILGYAGAIALVGCLVGISLGVVGTQAAATFARWLLGSSGLAPFLEGSQALEILILAFAASLAGCLYPSLRGRFVASEANQA